MKRLLASCFGLGWLPLAPGTWCSLVPMVLFAVLSTSGLSAVWVWLVMSFLFLAGSAVCLGCGPAVLAATGKSDPGEIVADEFAGQSLTYMLAAAAGGGTVCVTAIMGFLLFRLFDITKPWPIRKLEKLKGAWGVLADDLLAGLYAGTALILFYKFGLTGELDVFFACPDGSEPGVLSAVILGIVQGLTEFLPVSSSGHLVLFETIFDFEPESSSMLLFDLAVHVGTAVAILVVFRKSITALLRDLLTSGRYGNNLLEIYKRSPAVHVLVLAVVATIVTGLVGVLFERFFRLARGELVVVALMWIVTATLLLITDRRKKTRMSLRKFGILAALIVGLAQACAIMPGISRSGATICAAILIGLHRRWAVEFSFLLAIPAIAGAAIIEFGRNFGQFSSGGLSAGAVLIGAAVATVTGLFALKLLIKASRRANLKFFAFYCYILAGAVLIIWLLKTS